MGGGSPLNDFMMCKDYIQSAFGKIIYSSIKYNFGNSNENIEFYQTFLESLPLKRAENECILQITNLLELISEYEKHFNDKFMILKIASKVIGLIYETRNS